MPEIQCVHQNWKHFSTQSNPHNANLRDVTASCTISEQQARGAKKKGLEAGLPPRGSVYEAEVSL